MPNVSLEHIHGSIYTFLSHSDPSLLRVIVLEILGHISQKDVVVLTFFSNCTSWSPADLHLCSIYQVIHPHLFWGVRRASGSG